MFDSVKRLWSRSVSVPEITPIIIDTCRLDESLQLLRTTTVEVSVAAVNAAKVLEERLHDTEHRFHSTIDSISDLVIIKDYAGRWKTVNRCGQELYGWVHGEYFNKTDQELMVEYPQFAASLAVCIKTDEAAWDSGISSRSDESVPYGRGYRYFDAMKTPVYHADGTRKELIVIGRDVTELQEKQKRTKACFTALNSASDVIVILDKVGRIFFCNDKFTETYRLPDYGCVVGERLRDVIPLPLIDEMWATVKQNKTWEGPIGDDQFLTIIPMMNGAPEPIYYVCTMKRLT